MAYSVIGHVTAGSATGNSVTTGALNTTGADLLVLVLGQESAAALCTISDSKGNTWNQLTVQTESPVKGAIFWSRPTSVGSGHTFTATGSSASPAIAVSAFAGARLVSPFDQENGSHSSIGSTIATGSVTPTEDNELVIAGFAGRGGSGAIVSIDSSFTLGASTTAGAANDTAGIAYKIQTTAAAVNPTWTVTSSGSVKAAMIATFKLAGPLVATPGVFTMTGVDATIRPLRLVGAEGAFSYTGQSAILRKSTPTSITVFIDGDDYTDGVEFSTLTKEESNDLLVSNTCSFDYYGDTPPEELKEIVVTRSTNETEFAGTVLTVKQFYNGIRHNIGWRISCQDFTWLFNDGRFSYKWPGAVSASTIAAAIVAFRSGFTSTNVEGSLATVTDFEIINKTRGEALKELANRIGARTVKVDYDLDVHFRVTPAVTDLPDDIDDVAYSGDQLMRTSESGQYRTRQRGLGVRVRIPSLVPAGSTTIPVETVDNLPASGEIQVGSRTLTFTAQTNTQTPSGIAGTAAAPSVALASSPAGGVLGAVRYCVTFETPDGETPPGTQSSQVTGATIAAPSVGSANAQHSLAVAVSGDWYSHGVTIIRSGSRMTLSGGPSTLAPGARVYIFNSTTGTFDGTWTISGSSAGTPYVDGVSTSAPAGDTALLQVLTAGPLVGSYSYKFAWVSSKGISALSSAMNTTVSAVAVTSSASATATTGGALTTSSNYQYFYTAYTETSETSPLTLFGSWVSLTGANNAFSLLISTLNSTSGWDDPRIRGFRLYRGRAGEVIPRLVADFSRSALQARGAFTGSWTVVDTTADASLGGLPQTGGLVGGAIGLTGLPTWSDSRVTGLMVFRTEASGSTYYPVGTVSSSAATGFFDTMSDAQLVQQAPAPTTSFGGHCVTLTSIATLTGATARNIYRLFNGVWRYCGTISDNTTTTFTDSKADEDLGAPIKIAGYLTGLTATGTDILAGEVGRLHVVRDDTVAQALVLAAMGRGNGVFEGPVLDDDTLTQTALEAACDAELEAFSSALRSVTFRSRDVDLAPGKTITIALGGTTDISGTFLIQRVVSNEFHKADGLLPLRKVTAGPVFNTLRKTLAA